MKLFRKSIMFLIVLATSLCFFVLGTNEVKAADVVAEQVDFKTQKFSSNSYTDSWKYGDWTVSGGANNAGKWNYIKIGGKAANLEIYKDFYVASPVISEQTTKVTVNIIAGSLAKTGMSVNSWGLYVYSDSSMTELVDSVTGGTITKEAALFTFVPSNGTKWPANSYYKVKFDLSNTSSTNGIIWLDNVSIYKEADVSLPQLSTPVVSVEEKVASWGAVAGAVEYNVGLYDSVEALAAKYEITTNETSYDFTNVVSVGTWYVKVKAVADNVNATSSEYSSNEATFTNSISEINCTPTEFLSFVDFNTSVTFVLKGSLESFYEGGYKENYNNASFYLTDGTSKVICYRVPGKEGAKLQVGDVVTVSGKLQVYNDINQIGQGGKYVEIIPGAALEFEKLETKTSLKLTLENDEVSAVAIRFGMMIPVEQYDALVAAGATFGVAVVKKATLASTELSSVVDKYAFVCDSVVRVNEAGVADAEGAYYQFSFVVNNVPSVSYNEVLVAACYVLINGVYYVAGEATHSVQSVANVYVNADDTSSYTKYLDILNKLAGK